jgi:cytochrome c
MHHSFLSVSVPISTCLIVAATACLLAPPSASAQGCDVERGRKAFEACESCHTLDRSEPELTGPTLDDVFGRKAASIPDFPYSDAMASLDWTWNAKTLDRFLRDPAHVVPGTAMESSGVRNDADRAALICLLREKSQ